MLPPVVKYFYITTHFHKCPWSGRAPDVYTRQRVLLYVHVCVCVSVSRPWKPGCGPEKEPISERTVCQEVLSTSLTSSQDRLGTHLRRTAGRTNTCRTPGRNRPEDRPEKHRKKSLRRTGESPPEPSFTETHLPSLPPPSLPLGSAAAAAAQRHGADNKCSPAAVDPGGLSWKLLRFWCGSDPRVNGT